MVKKLCCLVLCTGLLVSFANAAQYVANITHSSVGFTIKHLSVSDVSGKFDDFNATVNMENGIPKEMEAVINTDSLDTNSRPRDEHLKSIEFFDTSKFPTMKFIMTNFQGEKDNKGKVNGNLTIKNITKPVVLEYKYGGISKNSKGDKVIGFILTGNIKRKDFNFAPNTGSLTLSDDVKLNIEVEMVGK